MLAACGLFSRRRLELAWWSLLALGLVSYCLGGVVYTVCYLYVPGFNLFRRPIVLRLFLLFSVAVMAALGCDAVQGASRRRGGSRVMFVASGLGLAGLIYGIAGWIGQIEPPDWWLSLVRASDGAGELVARVDLQFERFAELSREMVLVASTVAASTPLSTSLAQ